jgi:hypothetical protein
MGAVMIVMGMAEKKPAAEIWAIVKGWFGPVCWNFETSCLPTSYP